MSDEYEETLKPRKTIIIVLDSLGVGELPDADQYGDKGANTLGHLSEAVGGISIPNLSSLGLANLTYTKGGERVEETMGFYGKMRERSAGKDTSTGHWELAGLDIQEPFVTYPDGFPDELLKALSEKTNLEFIGNYPESGTVILEQLGEQSEKEAKPIVYTSADSVFQIAAHTDVIPLEKLYEVCEIARELCDNYGIVRVIARPFNGQAGYYKRLAERKDYSVPPPHETLLNALSNQNIPVHGVGKIASIYNYSGVKTSTITKSNLETMQTTQDLIRECDTDEDGQCLIFSNLVDFDMLYGHRRDPEGYAKALEEFDNFLPRILRSLDNNDVLYLTADHGNDPTFPGSDHTREHVPILMYCRALKPGRHGSLGVRKTFADLAETISEAYELENHYGAVSFWKNVLQQGLGQKKSIEY